MHATMSVVPSAVYSKVAAGARRVSTVGYVPSFGDLFGEPPVAPRFPDAYASRGRTSYALPEHYLGSNPLLRSVILSSLAVSDLFPFARLLPLEPSDEINGTFERYTGFRHLLDISPEEAPPVEVQTQREVGSVTMQRHSKALRLEHGFMRTLSGLRQYESNVRSIINAITHTFYVRVLALLMRQATYLDRVLIHRDHIAHSDRLYELLREEIDMFGAVQKKPYALEWLAKKVDLQREKRPLSDAYDTIVLPCRVPGAVASLAPENRVYAISGEMRAQLPPDAPAEVTLKPYIVAGGYELYTAETIHVSNNSGPGFNPMLRTRDIGNMWYIGLGRDIPPTEPTPGALDIQIIDYSIRDYVTITLMDALEHSGLFDEDHPMHKETIGSVMAYMKESERMQWTLNVGKQLAVIYGINAAEKDSKGNPKPAKPAYEFKDYLKTQLGSRDAMEKWINLGISVPVGATVFRPNVRLQMGSVIVMHAGYNTGMLRYGHFDFQLSDDVIRKVHEGHLTLYFAPVVVNGDNVTVVQDAVFVNLQGGASARWYHRWTDYRPGDYGRRGESLLATVDFVGSMKKSMGLPSDISDLSGRFADEDRTEFYRKDGKTMFDLYMYAKRRIEQCCGSYDKPDDSYDTDVEFAQYQVGPNHVCLRGHCRRRNPVTRVFDVIQGNLGHLGDAEYPGFASILNGDPGPRRAISYNPHSRHVSIGPE